MFIRESASMAMEPYDFVEWSRQDKDSHKKDAELVAVDLNSVTTMQSRSLGPELVAHTAWHKLGMDGFPRDLGFSQQQRALAEALVVGRLVDFCSDLGIWKWLTTVQRCRNFFRPI